MPQTRSVISEVQLAEFLARHRLPESFRDTALQHYVPLVERLPSGKPSARPMLLGINGAQGTGKSTLADFVQMATDAMFGWSGAVLSIDDFYLTRAERQQLAQSVHPLFETRGVPGTHDTAMLAKTLDALAFLSAGSRIPLPRFDKSIDDRAPQATWPVVEGPLDLIILEGWCVGSTAEPPDKLARPVNALERIEDPDAVWRTYANERLATEYAPIFSQLDMLVLLAAPSFDAIYRWRLEQEQKLAGRTTTGGSAIMNESEIARFIRFYERITRNNLDTLPDTADAVLTLNEQHAVVESRYKN